MTDPKIDLKFAPLKVENAGRVSSIRLVADGRRAALALLGDASGGSLPVHLTPLDGSGAGRAHPLFKLESPFGSPSWDIANAGIGVAAVWTQPGSAIARLGYRTAQGAEVVLTGSYPSGVFQNPRFVRGDPASPSPGITAVAYKDGGRVLALFSSSLESGNASYATLPAAGSGMPQDGLLLRNGTGYLLFVKLLASGPRAVERKDGRGESIQSGILRCLRLDAKLQPLDVSSGPVGGTAIYEFDADLSRGRVFLLATTEKGYIAGTAGASGGDLYWTTSEIPVRAELTAPSVLGAGGAAHAAALESAASQRTQILIGRY